MGAAADLGGLDGTRTGCICQIMQHRLYARFGMGNVVVWLQGSALDWVAGVAGRGGDSCGRLKADVCELVH